MTRVAIVCLQRSFAGLCNQSQILIGPCGIFCLGSSNNFFFTEVTWYIAQLPETIGRGLGNDGQEKVE